MKITPKKIICQDCGEETPKRTNGPQKYCVSCSEKADKRRKQKWLNKTGYKQTPEQVAERRKKEKSAAILKGEEINEKQKVSIAWPAEIDDSITTSVRTSVPFQYGISKNAAWKMSKSGHVFLRKNHSAIRNALVMRIKTAAKHVKFYEDKIWIDIFVQKPNHKGDAINVVDAVCDAVKVAIDVDDRWFSIRKLDWQIAKKDPMLFVGIGQNSTGDKRICSYCGQILSLDHFWKDKNDRLGVGRECKSCVTGKRKKKK